MGSVNSASEEYAGQLESELDRLGLRELAQIDRDVTFDCMPGILACADIVSQPSHAEGLCLALLEALSSGRATVETDTPGTIEVLSAPGIAEVVPPQEVAPQRRSADVRHRPPPLPRAPLAPLPGLHGRYGSRSDLGRAASSLKSADDIAYSGPSSMTPSGSGLAEVYDGMARWARSRCLPAPVCDFTSRVLHTLSHLAVPIALPSQKATEKSDDAPATEAGEEQAGPLRHP